MKKPKGEESFHTLFQMHLKREQKSANFERLLLTLLNIFTVNLKNIFMDFFFQIAKFKGIF